MAANTHITSAQEPRRGPSGLVLAWTRLQSFRPGDAGTAARARLRIHRTLGADGADVRATAVGGFVELRGTVASRDVYERAATVAREALGARGVLNFLEVR